jgi:hypothetical protein
LIDVTPWIDTHEHLVEEHLRLRTEGCAIEEMNGEKG